MKALKFTKNTLITRQLANSLRLSYSFINKTPSIQKTFNQTNQPSAFQPNSLFSKVNYFFSYPEHQRLGLPSLSPTMEKGNIAKWLKKEGDALSAGDVICEIETDKATVGFEVQEEGFLAKILVPEGTKDIPVGYIVAVSVNKKSLIDSFKNFTGKPDQSPPKPEQSTPKQELPPAQVQQQPAQPSPKPAVAQSVKTYPQHRLLGLPALSPTMESGQIGKWNKKEGDKVETGDVLCEVETDKAMVGFEFQDDTGYIAKIVKPSGSGQIKVGDIVCIVVKNAASVKEFSDYVHGAAPVSTPIAAKSAESEPQIQQQVVQQTQSQVSGSRVFISPLAKKTAAELGIDYSQMKGSGPNNRIINQDVLEFKQAKPAETVVQVATPAQPSISQVAEAPKQAVQQEEKPVKKEELKSQTVVSTAAYEDIPNSNIRKVIAQRLSESKRDVPHFYLTISVNMDKCLEIRADLNKISPAKISVNDMIIKASALALRDIPDANSSWRGEFIRKFKNVDISVAVSTDSGLITPIVFNADQLGLSKIAKITKELADKARKNKLKPAEYQGGTFCISNLGMFGIEEFSAIINPPQGMILAVGKSEMKPVYNEKNPTEIKWSNMMKATLSVDHRVVDGSLGAIWLDKLKKYLEDPKSMLL